MLGTSLALLRREMSKELWSPRASLFCSARQRVRSAPPSSVAHEHMVFRGPPAGGHERVYNAPTSGSELSVAYEENAMLSHVTMVLTRQSGGLVPIRPDNAYFDALRFPLLLPGGGATWTFGIRKRSGRQQVYRAPTPYTLHPSPLTLNP